MSKSNTTGENDHPIVAIVSKETDTTLTSSDDAAQTSVTGSWLAKIIDSRYVQSNALSRHLAARVACYMKNRKQRSPPWVKTIIRFGPLSGIFTMLLTIASLVASLGILVGSDARAVESWAVSPSTWIAIFTALANLSIRYAALQGVIVAWWSRATRGSSLGRLHYDWRAGTTIRGAIASGRHMGLLGLACIFSTIVVIDGPLLQRSTSVVPAARSQPVDLKVVMAEEIPHGLTGSWIYNQGNFSALWQGETPQFNRTIPTSNPNKSVLNGPLTDNAPWMGLNVSGPWYDSESLEGVVHGCNDTCTAKIRAPAFAATTCTSYVIPVDYHVLYNWSIISQNTWNVIPPMGSYAYFIASSMVMENDREWVNMVTGYASTEDCKGTLNYTACTLESAIGEYEVDIKGNRITLSSPESPTIIALANNTKPNSTWDQERAGYPSTLGGIESFARETWSSSVFIQSFPNGKIDPYFYGSSCNVRMQTTADPFCPSFRDPRPDFLASLNKLMFYTGAIAPARFDTDYLESRMDEGLSIKKTVVGHVTGTHNVFHTSYPFFIAAAVFELVCIALIAPTYWGWWRLGRHVSFSPLEIAKAFEAPILENCNSNFSGQRMAQEVGGVEVRYGVVTDESEKSKLAFASPDRSSRIESESRFEM